MGCNLYRYVRENWPGVPAVWGVSSEGEERISDRFSDSLNLSILISFLENVLGVRLLYTVYFIL